MLIKRERDTIQSFFEDNSNLKGGYAEAVVFPEGEEELSEFLREANKKKMPVTISGGGTGVTGARIPFGGFVISTERMNKILKVDDGYGVVQPGVLAEDFLRAVEENGFIYPCLPTEMSAFLGGTVATNSSGARSFKYGQTRRYVRRLKLALADGAVLDVKRGVSFANKEGKIKVPLPDGRELSIPIPSYKMPQIKNAAGYYSKKGMDLIDLFIGQEGTLGVITEIEIKLINRPESTFSCFAFSTMEESCLNFSKDARGKRGVDGLTLEYFDENSLNLLRERFQNIPQRARGCIFFEDEIRSGNEDEVVGKWEGLLKKHGIPLDDTWVALSSREEERFKEIRHAIPTLVNELQRRKGLPKVGTDIAVPHENFDEMMGLYSKLLKEADIPYVVFGHIGECHLHVNLLPSSEREVELSKSLCLEFVRKGVSLGGTVSAEHGIGKIKHHYLEELYGREGLREMAELKKALDPNCILGRGNIFPQELLE